MRRGGAGPAVTPGRLKAEFLDRLHASIANKIRLYPGGWGDRAILARAGQWFSESAHVDIAWEGYRGTFRSPYAEWGLPPESQTAHVELLLPRGWTSSTPMVVHFPSTGDEFCVLARRSAEAMLAQGMGSVVLEVAYYGARKPAWQNSTYLRTVSDLWGLGMAAWEEGRALLNWLRNQGFTRLGVCGISMGGLLASHVASLWDGPVAVASLASPHDAGVVYADSVLAREVDWKRLGRGCRDPRQRMREVLGPTDLGRFPLPVRPDACVRLGASYDLYAPPVSVQRTADCWPGSTLTWLPIGHVQAVAWNGFRLAGCMAEAFGRL